MVSFHYLPVDTRTVRSGCYLTALGAGAYKAGEKYPCDGHPPGFEFDWASSRVVPDFGFVWIQAGSGEWESPVGHRQTVDAGDVIYLVPGSWHRYRPAKRGWTESWFCLQGVSVHAYARCGILPVSCRLLKGAVTNRLRETMDGLIKEVYSLRSVNRSSWGARALAVLLEYFEDSHARETGKRIADAHVEDALQYIRENSHRPLRVCEVAECCGLEKWTLERRFEKCGLEPVGRQIVKERVARAELLLAETDLPVKEIAFTCGFGGTQRMIYDFRIHRGTTPGRMRRR